MKLREIRDILEAVVLRGDDCLDREIEMASASDLLSDVLAFTRPGAILLTGLTNPQAVRTAEMVDIAAICFVRGKNPEESTVELARQKDIPLLITRFRMYESCGKLYGIGLLGCSEG